MDIYDESSIKDWKSNPYPENVNDHPVLKFDKKMYEIEGFFINGMIVDTLDNEVKY